MADKPVKYQYKTVQTVRGTESLSVSKWQKQGWELVDQTPGKLRTTLRFRKPASYKQWIQLGALMAFVLLALGMVSIVEAVRGDEENATAGDTPSATSTPPASPTPSVSETPSAAPSETPTESSTPTADPNAVITAKNNQEFAALLNKDYCDPAIADFAKEYEGRVIEFDGSIAAFAPHEDYDTRYDILIGPGDEGPNSVLGPAFKFEDENVFDLNFKGRVPGRIGTSDLLRVTAEVDEYSKQTCLFFLEPVETRIR